MPRKTDSEYAAQRDRQIDNAMSRLNIHKGHLICARGSYGGKLETDITLVLDELDRLRTSGEPPSLVAVDPVGGTG